MKVKKIYISEIDDEEFETEEECLEHEKACDPSNSVLMFSDDVHELLDSGDPLERFEHAFYIYILDGEKAKTFFGWVDIQAGYTTPLFPKTGDIYIFDSDAQEYANLDARIAELKRLLAARDYILKIAGVKENEK